MADRTLPIDLVQATVSLALRSGWDVNTLLEEAGLSPLLVAEGRARVTEEQLVTVLRSLWDRTDDELLGLGPHPLPRGSFRLLLFGIAGARDLGDALERLRGFVRAFPALVFELEVDEREARISAPRDLDDETANIALLTGLAAGHRLISWAVGQGVSALRVELPFPRAHEETLRMMFDAPLVYHAPRAAIVVEADLLRRPFVRSDEEIEQVVAQAPRWFLSRPRREVTLSAQVRRYVESTIAGGRWPEAPDVASRLTVSPQTLRRRLAEEGTSFRAISDEVRRDVAITSLVAGTESIADLSARLGFSEPSAFTRAFRRWTGDAPSAYRRAGPE